MTRHNWVPTYFSDFIAAIGNRSHSNQTKHSFFPRDLMLMQTLGACSAVYIYRSRQQHTLSGKSHYEKRNVLGLGLPKSKSLGNFLQHLQKSKFFNDVFWRNCDLKFFPYKTSRDRKARITKRSVWRSSWSKKFH